MIKVENKGSDIFEFGRQGNVPYIKKHKFQPYFFYEDTTGNFKTIDGKNATKLVLKNPKEVPVVREQYNKTYESDIVYTNRFIIDNYKIIKQDKIRICYIDIEIARTKNGYESAVKATNPILCIGTYDNFDKEYKTFCINKTHREEKEMMKDFIKWFVKKDPDLVVAWNGDNFDFPFLINRMKNLGLNPNLLARQSSEFRGEVKIVGDRNFIKIEGRVMFDLMYAYRKMISGEGRESWSLDYICKYEGVGQKEKYKGELDDLFKNNLEKFISYNKRDVELLVLLDEKLHIVDFFDSVRRMCFCQFEDVFMNSKIADCLCLKKAKELNVVLPSCKRNKRENIKGGFVQDSVPKLYKNVVCMDMKSLYPSIMIGFNTSYETILEKKEKNCIDVYGKYFYKRERGIIPSIVKPLLTKRNEIKKIMKNIDRNSKEFKSLYMEQYTLKVIANSFYGVMGFPLFRLFKSDVANSITFIARQIIMEVSKWFKEKGLKVIYGDTDSVFIEMGNLTKNDFVKLNHEINNYFKDYFKKFGVSDENNIFQLEFEKVFKSIFFKKKTDGKGAKKRYAGRVIWENGKEVEKFITVGFESKRSDTSTIGRKFISDVLKMICYGSKKKEIDKFISEFKKELKKQAIEDIAIPIGISKPLENYKNVIHIRAARNANRLHNAQIQSGDKIKYVYIIHKDMNVIAFKSSSWMWDGYKIDWKMMEKRIVDMKIQPIYESLGWNYPWEIFMPTKKKKQIKFEEQMKQKSLW